MTSEMRATKHAAAESPPHRRFSAAAEEPTLASASSSAASAFDDFAEDECVGNGFRIGDLVWGKVESHPWWPGFIYDEDFASKSVRSGGRRNHVLVAFLGDGSYGWFHPLELIPFEKNFAEKSRQTASEGFAAAVEEAVDEVSRRRSLGLVCRCRNEFNFWPAKVKGYSVVDVGDSEPWLYSTSQIRKARDGFQPREMVSFLKELALDPMRAGHGTIALIENKATVLACRKALYEEFDETYAQAFGSVPVRPPRPTAPVALDPSKAPLSGRLVIAEALGKDERSVKPTKNMERDRHLSKLREEAIQIKSKKASSHPVLVYGSGYLKKAMYRHQPMGYQASISIDRKPRESSREFAEGEPKKAKVPKRPAEQLTAEIEKKVVKKKKNIINTEKTGVKPRQLPVAISTTANELDNVSKEPAPLSNNVRDYQKRGAKVGPPPYRSQQEMDVERRELQMFVTDLRALARNPLHKKATSCPAVIKQVFSKYRSLVYQKSLVLHPPPADEKESIEAKPNRLPAAPVKVTTNDNKIVKNPSLRHDDPTKGGKKRSLSDWPEFIKKKSLEDFKKRKIDCSWDSKKKNVDGPKPPVAVKKNILHLPSSEREGSNVRATSDKDLPPTARKVAKLESSKKKTEDVRKKKLNPTMLVMRFPAGATLPSGPEVQARFTRFGPLDHSAMRIFWKTHTVKLVYLLRTDAQEALKFASKSENLFGCSNLRCHIRELEVDPAETSKKKVGGDCAEMTLKISDPTHQHPPCQQPRQPVNMKPCLKKSSGGEGGNGGGGRSARVKFVLGGEDEALLNEKKNSLQNIAPCKMLPKLVDPKLQKVPVNMASSSSSSMRGQRISPPAEEFSLEMIALLTRCSDVVSDVASALGYMPYHPL